VWRMKTAEVFFTDAALSQGDRCREKHRLRRVGNIVDRIPFPKKTQGVVFLGRGSARLRGRPYCIVACRWRNGGIWATIHWRM
jgi:hypothetical protein